MRNVQNYILASPSLCCTYFLYVHIYSSHKLLKTNSFSWERLPRLSYLFMKYLSKALSRRKGCLYNPRERKKWDVVYAVHNCRLSTVLLRRYCSAAGYGWDYPDSEYRGVPLCFPEVMCRTLLLMAITDHNFRLSPVGLVCVRQSIKTHQPVDELKRGPFTLQVQVLVYRPMDVGVEVDVLLSATSRSKSLVWESILTLLSKNKNQVAIECEANNENATLTRKKDEADFQGVKQVHFKVPLSAGPPCSWSFLEYWFLYLPDTLFGFKLRPMSSLWMLSVCLAEIEKHKGVGVITSPLNILAQFEERLLTPNKVTLSFWRCQSSTQDLSFQMYQHEGTKFYLTGGIARN
ncbi:uncharacterized protein si:ch211-12e13.1 isoform X1 [Syngnathoides biaculeatus]|uniref:uncharacterized protein si:ch211-12e13.1 isoform X1 n=1 Tax=Syngnathoides biaculeatus TaxID=300417 RepID=UPI002ADD6D02|nr:uncharacterized protein si:ch211-12e13.1 isoform X1 [Syngnathoides biaculeatus]